MKEPRCCQRCGRTYERGLSLAEQKGAFCGRPCETEFALKITEEIPLGHAETCNLGTKMLSHMTSAELAEWRRRMLQMLANVPALLPDNRLAP